MAALSITATNVLPTAATRANFPNTIIQFGETVTAGQSLYKKAADGKYYKAIANDTAEKAGSGDVGIALGGGAVNQWGLMQKAGNITLGAGSVGVEYYVSAAAAGAIVPFSDLASTNNVTRLGQCVSTGVILMDIKIETALA